MQHVCCILEFISDVIYFYIPLFNLKFNRLWLRYYLSVSLKKKCNKKHTFSYLVYICCTVLS